MGSDLKLLIVKEDGVMVGRSLSPGLTFSDGGGGGLAMAKA